MKYIKLLLLTLIIPLFGSCRYVEIINYNVYHENEISKYEYWAIEFTQEQSVYSKSVELSEDTKTQVISPLYSPLAFQMKEDIFFYLLDFYRMKMVRKNGTDVGIIKIHPVFKSNSDIINTMDVRLESPDGRTLARMKLERKYSTSNEEFSKQASEKIYELIYGKK